MVGDGYSMGVTAEIVKYMLGATEGAFRIDHPVLSEQWPEPCGECVRLGKGLEVSMEAELAVLEGVLQSSNELAAEDATEDLTGRKKACRVWIQHV